MSEKQVQLLGVAIDVKLHFNQQVSTFCRKAGAQLRVFEHFQVLCIEPLQLLFSSVELLWRGTYSWNGTHPVESYEMCL